MLSAMFYGIHEIEFYVMTQKETEHTTNNIHRHGNRQCSSSSKNQQ